VTLVHLLNSGHAIRASRVSVDDPVGVHETARALELRLSLLGHLERTIALLLELPGAHRTLGFLIAHGHEASGEDLLAVQLGMRLLSIHHVELKLPLGLRKGRGFLGGVPWVGVIRLEHVLCGDVGVPLSVHSVPRD